MLVILVMKTKRIIIGLNLKVEIEILNGFYLRSLADKRSRRFWTTDVRKPFDCHFSCKTKSTDNSNNIGKAMILSQQKITRQIMGPGVTRIPVNGGRIKGA